MCHSDRCRNPSLSVIGKRSEESRKIFLNHFSLDSSLTLKMTECNVIVNELLGIEVWGLGIGN